MVKKKKTKKKLVRKISSKKTSSKKRVAKPRQITVDCTHFKQVDTDMYVFSMRAKKLWKYVDVNRRVENKTKGYQRAFSQSRVRKIAKYIDNSNVIPGAILVSLDHAKINRAKNKLTIEGNAHSGWVIDGQHRLIGASESDKDITMLVVAFLDLKLAKQIEFFVTINKEQKGVPSSLYLDLLQHLPGTKTDKELLEERANDLATQLKNDPNSPFNNRLVVTTSPRKGQLSTTNFIRKIVPHIRPNGRLANIPDEDRASILNSYYRGLKEVFPEHFDDPSSVFYKTIGFGALMEVLPTMMDLTVKLAKRSALRTQDFKKAFSELDDHDFDTWKEMGTGSAAETHAASDLRIKIEDILSSLGSMYVLDD